MDVSVRENGAAQWEPGCCGSRGQLVWNEIDPWGGDDYGEAT